MRGRRWPDIVSYHTSLCHTLSCRSSLRLWFSVLLDGFQKHKNIVSRTHHTQKAKSPGYLGTPVFRRQTEGVQASRTLPLTTSLDADPRFNGSLSGATPIFASNSSNSSKVMVPLWGAWVEYGHEK